MQATIRNILARLRTKDREKVFLNPVNLSDVSVSCLSACRYSQLTVQYPDYATTVTKPMDLARMGTKNDDGEYSSLAELEADIVLMCGTCQRYNEPCDPRFACV